MSRADEGSLTIGQAALFNEDCWIGMRSSIVDTGIDGIDFALLMALPILERTDAYVDHLVDYLEADFPDYFDTDDWKSKRAARACSV